MKAQTTESLRAVLAANLKALRANKGLAQEALALDAGVHRTMLSKLERELANPSLETLIKLANRLEVPVSELLSVR